MTADLPTSMRSRIARRADYRCEYCRMPERFALHLHEPDHIVPRQHGGKTQLDNLALACFRCNRHKGPNVGSFDPDSGALVPFFNPRLHRWQDHFHMDGSVICPLTPEARVTVLILRMNDPERVMERRRLIELGVY